MINSRALNHNVLFQSINAKNYNVHISVAVCGDAGAGMRPLPVEAQCCRHTRICPSCGILCGARWKLNRRNIRYGGKAVLRILSEDHQQRNTVPPTL